MKTIFISSLDKPFRSLLNGILKHKEKGHICPILLKECPFNELTFVQKIQLGRQQIEREFLDEILDTVISDMNTPQTLTRIQATKSWNYACLFLSVLILIVNFIFALNFSLGLGKF